MIKPHQRESLHQVRGKSKSYDNGPANGLLAIDQQIAGVMERQTTI
jgi:hypothetical protein